MNQIMPNEIFTDSRGRYRAELFTYAVNFAIPAAAAPIVVSNLQIQAEADFVWQQGTYNLFTAAAADETVTAANVEIPDLTVQILDSANGKNMFFTPVQIQAMFSNTAQFPAILPVAREIRAAASLSFTVSSTKTYAAAYNLQLLLTGFKKIRDVG